MTEQFANPSPDLQALETLSNRISTALEDDARRRRWITRTFVVLAIVPAAAAVLVFALGRTDLEQTRVVVREQTRDIETQVAEKITASVAGDLQGAREVAVLLPQLKSAVEVLPLVRENQRTLTDYRAAVDASVEQQQKLSQSIESAARNLAQIPAELGELETRIEQASNRADTAQSRAAAALENMNANAQALEARVKQTEGQLTEVARVEKSVASIESELRKTRADLERQVDDRVRALSATGTDTRRLQGIEKRLDSLAGQSEQLQALRAQVARLPKQAVNTNTLKRSIDSLSRQMAAIDKRLAALERGRNGGSANVSNALRSLQARIDSMNQSIDGRIGRIERRLAALERSRRTVIK